MRGERTTDRTALVNRHGLSLRLAARIVALLVKKLDVSETVLEAAARDSSLEALLLDGRLLGEADTLDEQKLKGIAQEHTFKDSALLRLVGNPEGWRTIAFEDDLLAEEASGEKPLPGMELVRTAAAGISRRETEALFTPEEIARLKLTVLTSQNMEERIEALRKIVFAPLSGAQKAGIFVSAVVDPSADRKVRGEAVRALEQIGFRSDLADAVKRLFEAQEGEVLHAIQRLSSLLTDAQEAERGVTLAVVLEVLNETRSRPVVAELLRMISQSAGILARNLQKTEQFIQSALRRLAEDFDRLRLEVEKAIMACHKESPQEVADLLWKEMERSAEPRVKSFLVNLCIALTVDTEKTKQLAVMAIFQVLDPNVREQERVTLRYGLIRLGEEAARMVVQRLRGETGRRCVELVRLLDAVCARGRVPEETVSEAVEALLDTLRVGERAARRAVLEAQICADTRVRPDLQSRLAAEFLAHLVEFRLPGTAEVICGTLEKIGSPALQPLFDYIVRRYGSDEAERAFLSVGKIVMAQGRSAPEELCRALFDYCMGLFEDRENKSGNFTVAIACLCGYTPFGAGVFERVLQVMRDRLLKARYSLEMFDALGIMAGSDNAAPPQQRELFELFDRMLSMEGPGELSVKRKTAEGFVYEFGPKVYFDTRIVPACVKGLERICISGNAPPGLRRDVVRRMLVLWEGVSNVRVVWSPAAVEALIHAISSAACSPLLGVDLCVRLGRALLRFLNKVSVVRAIGQICSRPESDARMREFCMESGENMLHEWETCDQQDEERKIALLGSLGLLAANTSLDLRDGRVQRLRENVMSALFQALRAGIHEVRAPLERFRDCPDIPAEQREEIRERLSRAFGLMRLGQ